MTQRPEIISVQSRVSWGYVGNAVAVPVCQAFGVHAWPVDTVRLAHHPGHGAVDAAVTDAGELSATLRATLRLTPPGSPVLMGYLGAAEQGEAVLETIPSGTTLIIDPAFGDVPKGVYVDPAIVDFQKAAVSRADWLLPNAFELGTLTARPVTSIDEAATAARELLERGAGGVVVTSVPNGADIVNLLVGQAEMKVIPVTARSLRAKGTGDLLSAIFCAGLANGREPAAALADAVAVTALAVDLALADDATELDIPGILPKICAWANRPV